MLMLLDNFSPLSYHTSMGESAQYGGYGKRRVLGYVAAVIVILVGLSAWGVTSMMDAGRSQADDPATRDMIAARVEASVASMVRGFTYSQVPPLLAGDYMAPLPLPLLQGKTPDWEVPMVISVGYGTSKSAVSLHEALVGLPIQQVHIVSAALGGTVELATFPSSVTILDGTGAEAGSEGLLPSELISNAFGVFKVSSGYIRGADGNLVFAQPNKANFDGLTEAAKAFALDGVRGESTGTVHIVASGNMLPIDELQLDSDELQMLKQTLSADRVVLFIIDDSICDLCIDWVGRSGPYIQEWVDSGYGVVIVDSASQVGSVAVDESGALVVSLPRRDGQLVPVGMESWGITGLPATLIVSRRQYLGAIPYMEAQINGVEHRNYIFKAASRVLASLR